MPTTAETVERIVNAKGWNQRIAQIRMVPAHHGLAEHTTVFAAVARALYVPDLVPDFAYVHHDPFYDEDHFLASYNLAAEATNGFTQVSENDLTRVIEREPRTLLTFRTLIGLGRDEFSMSTGLVGTKSKVRQLSAAKVDSMERMGTLTTVAQSRLAAKTITRIMDGTLFAEPPPGFKLKQAKADTRSGWKSVQDFAANGVNFGIFLHQRYYGGSFRQVLDATSQKRGDILEEAVEELFKKNKISYIRTGGHNQVEIAQRFEVTVTPAPDFVVFDDSDVLKGMLECKGTNDGGTARDKALRFGRLRNESLRLGGIPLFAVLGGTGWKRINDALAPVLRDTDGRVFTLKTLTTMLGVAPFPSLTR